MFSQLEDKDHLLKNSLKLLNLLKNHTVSHFDLKLYLFKAMEMSQNAMRNAIR